MAIQRGTYINLPNRFELRKDEQFDDGWEIKPEALELPVVQTEFIPDNTKSIISYVDSPDLAMMSSINPYRGCEHGCAYCYARPSHEYLGYNSALDFESKILIKPRAAEILRSEMMKPTYKPTILALSGNTDCYQPAERKFKITRSILETLLEFNHPVGIITKNALVTRDIDILSEMAKRDLVMVNFSITTLDLELSRKLEPRTATPQRKLEALRKLTDAGIPCGIMNAPIIPGLNDKETPAVLKAAAEYGALSAGYTMIRLSYGLRDIFQDWLKKNIPLEENRILSRIRMVRDGELTSTVWGERMRGNGAYADYIKNQFKVMARKYGLNQKHVHITTEHFKRPGTLFG